MNSTPPSPSTGSSEPVSTQSLPVPSSARLQSREAGIELGTPDAVSAPVTGADDNFFDQFLRTIPEPADNPTAPPAQGGADGRQASAPAQPAAPAVAPTPGQPVAQPATPKPIVLNLDAGDETFTDDDGKPVVPAVVPPVAPAPVTPSAVQPNEPLRRNTEGLPPEIAKVVPQMSNGAWARLEPILREHQAMRNERYADHPEGYMLAPEYTEMLNYFSTTQQEVDFATDQLARARAGENFYVLVTDEQGKQTKSGPYQATTESVKQLEALILDGKAALNQVQQQAVAFKNQFTEAHKKLDERLSAILKPVFEPYKKDLDARIDKALEGHKLPRYLAQRTDLRNQVGLMLLFQSATREISRLQAVIAASGGNATPPSTSTPKPVPSSAITKRHEDFFNAYLPKV